MKTKNGSPQAAASAAALARAAGGTGAAPTGAGAPPSAPRDLVRPPAPLRAVQLGPRAVGSWVPRLTRPAFEKYGFSAAALITDWATIVGGSLAAYTAPERLKWPRQTGTGREAEDGARPPATLVLAVDPGRALDVQYRARQIADRINAYFGYRAVGDLRIVQAPVATPRAADVRAAAAAPKREPPPPPAEVTAIADNGLREALARMAIARAQRA